MLMLDVERRGTVEDTWQVMRLLVKVLMLDVLIMKGQVTVKVLLEVKVFVEEVLLFSLSSTPFPRPAARVWAWGAKGSGFPIVFWILFLKHGPCLS